MVPTRSNDFIFNKIGWWFPANMLLNGLWLPTFQSNTSVGFTIAFIIMIALLTTSLVMAKRACNAELNAIEVICLRSAMSIYSGWVGCATIISASMMLKMYFTVNEAAWGVGMLWIALVLYIVNTYVNMDPLFGGVLVWACCAIRSKNTNAMLESNLKAIIGIMSMYVCIIAAYALYMKFKKSKPEAVAAKNNDW